ncbi:MAG: AraC family transcriptional regulator [Chthoniobacteraceae bacterium]
MKTKPRQSDDWNLEEPATHDFSNNELPTVSYPRPKLHEVHLFGSECVFWRQTFSTHSPMVVLVHSGVLDMPRNGVRQQAKAGDTVLLTPGIFELRAMPAMHGGAVRLEYGKFPVSLLGTLLAGGGHMESVALRPKPDSEVFVQKGMLPEVLRNIETRPHGLNLMETIVMTLVHSGTPSVSPFLRRAYFNMRWAFQAMMESFSLRFTAVDDVAKRYVRGRAAFFADCEIYTGRTPMKWFRQRRMEHAYSWLHVANKHVWEVAAALGYKGISKFRTEYRKHFHRHPDEPHDPLSLGGELNIESPFCCLRPFWWPYPLPLGQHDLLGMHGAMFADRSAASSVEHNAPSIASEFQTVEVQPEDVGVEGCSAPNPVNPRAEESRTLIEKFKNLELIPITELLPFPADLPVLLKAA